MDQQHILHATLDESISSGKFVDTKFYVFSRRLNEPGRVGTPKALFANGRVLGFVPYFEALLSDGFSEGTPKNLRDGFPPCEQPYTDSYEYFSDSDLDPDEGEGYTDVDGRSSNDPATNESTNGSAAIVPDQEPIQTTLTVSESDIEDQVAATSDSGGRPEPVPCALQGRVAIIKDVAATTFEALLFYMYTGEIYFAPFGSETNRAYRASQNRSQGADNPPEASPKSIYRLADKYDISELKEIAREKIIEEIRSCDLVEEIFSDFTFSFSEIQEIQIKQLVYNLVALGDAGFQDTLGRFQEKLSNLYGVQLERSADILAAFWKELSKSDTVTVGDELSGGPPQGTVPKVLDHVKIALLRSIRTGTFIDRQFFAKSLSGHNGLRGRFTYPVLLQGSG